MLGRILALILGIGGLVAGSQAPNFTTHFMQNLEGRVDQLRLESAQALRRLEEAGMTRNMAKAACAASETEQQKANCETTEQIFVSYDTLREVQEELDAEGDWRRPLVLAQRTAQDGVVREFAQNATKNYEIAVPVTVQSAGYGGGLGLATWIIFRLLFGLIGAPFRRY